MPACSLVVLQLNDGDKAIKDVLEEIGCSVSEYNMNALELEDKMRIRKCEEKETLEQEKTQRKVRKRRRKGREDQAVDEEGTIYETGAFCTTFCRYFFWTSGWESAVFLTKSARFVLEGEAVCVAERAVMSDVRDTFMSSRHFSRAQKAQRKFLFSFFSFFLHFPTSYRRTVCRLAPSYI